MHKNQLTFEHVPIKYFPEWGFRPNTQMIQTEMNFIMINGGGGDYITWMRAIQWLAECATWIKGTLIHPVYFHDFAEYFLKDFPEWKHKDYTSLQQIPQNDPTPFRGPVMLQQESLNATGAHLMTCGWVYFTNKECAPEGNDRHGRPWNSYPHLPQKYLDSIELPHGTPEKGTYAVITTGVTTASRHIKPEYFNYLIEHVVKLGLKPVFLGKTLVETGNARNIHTAWGDKTRYDLGIDLRDKTSYLQAAAILSRAAVVIGHDNGLLHLAGCTEVPIVFGYNLASPQHRRPLRPEGKIYDVTLDDGELSCNFCQSKNNFVIGYNFQRCFYGDLKCMDLLFANEAAKWKKQIDLALSK